MVRVVVAGLVIAMLSTAARANDFVDVCTAVNKEELQQKVCKCMSEKVKDDRSAFIDMMKKLNEAQTKGTEPDPSKMSATEVKTLGTVMETLAACFQ